MEDLRVHGSLQFISLKKLNRIAHFRSKKVRDATTDVSAWSFVVVLLSELTILDTAVKQMSLSAE